MIRRVVDFALENPRDYRVIFMGAAEDFATVAPALRARKDQAPTFQFLVDRVRECMQARVLHEADAEETATLIWTDRRAY